MGRTTTLVLIAAILALLAVYEPGLRQTGHDSLPLTRLAPKDINNIVVERPGRDAIELKRTARGWRLVAPFTASANPLKASALASLAGARTNVWYEAEAADARALALDPPAARVRLNNVELQFGGVETLRDLRYVKVEDRVALLKDRFFHHIAASPSAFVDPVLIPKSVELIAIRVPGASLRRIDGEWQFNPGSAFASEATVEAFVSRWQVAAAMSVRTMDYQLNWRDAAHITTAERGSYTLQVATAPGRVLLGDAQLDLQYELPLAAGTALLDPNVTTN
ncbi:MAG: hypothetical protein CMQ61_05330 [Gammaproteobacteria bacterium]|nr:hypothetical protein [Gammaproteobacteria bacterium]